MPFTGPNFVPLESFWLRLLLTAAFFAAIIGVRYLAHRWLSGEGSLPEKSDERLAVSAGVAVVTAVGIVLIIDTWNLLPAIYYAIRNLGGEDAAGKLLVSGVLIGAAYALTGFLGRVLQFATGWGDAVSQHQREIVSRVTQVLIYSAVGLIVVSLFTNPRSILVGAGFLGIVVGMAANQTLGAVLAGFVLMFSRPFDIGDWVEIGDKEGIVTEISIVNTRLQTFDGEYVEIPNDQVSAEAIVNRTRKGRLRIEVEVGVDYDTDPEYAADAALDVIGDVDGVERVPTPQVILKSFGDSAVVLGARFWIDNPTRRRVWRARSNAVAAIKERFDAEGIKIPFPQRELAGRDEEGGFRLAGGRGPVAEAGADADAQATTDGGSE